VLIIGRANASKTTILQKVCNTTDEPEIHDTKGKKVRMMTYAMRAVEITNETVFMSNPDFVFHDPCTFEAGFETIHLDSLSLSRVSSCALKKKLTGEINCH
ncbi:hypothetical protein BDR06DRAFT_885909, partial [Suillus hirtellus]